MFEDVAVFHRGIGEGSDVARKEMYTFTDRGDRTYALRPEGTASVVRAFVQHNPTTPWKAWYATPAFRYERPQAGRYRQHHQLGVEALGSEDPYIDIEVISLAWRFYEAIGLRRVTLMVNSMGHGVCRSNFVTELSAHLERCSAQLCEEHQRTWAVNALRVIDCKKEGCRAVVAVGPSLPEYLCTDCREHFSVVTSGLDALGIPWTANPHLVRGFDYYTRTTFEFASQALEGSQNAIGGGGRYDGLVEMLGIPSLGPKKVKKLHDELGVDTIEALEAACQAGKVAVIEGFGEKTQAKILEGIAFKRQFASKHHLHKALAVAQPILENLRQHPDVTRCSTAGSLRRWKEVIGDVDIVASSRNPASVLDHFVALPGVRSVLAREVLRMYP